MAKSKRQAGRTKKVARPKKAARTAKKTAPKATARRVATKKPAPRRAAAPRAAAPRAAAPASNPLRALAKRIIDLTVSGNDEASLALYADNIESVEMGMPPGVGIEAIKQKFVMWRGMVSNTSWKAPNAWIDGNAIVIEWHGTVTLASTGKTVELKEIAIHEVQNGKIVRERFYYNPAALQP